MIVILLHRILVLSCHAQRRVFYRIFAATLYHYTSCSYILAAPHHSQPLLKQHSQGYTLAPGRGHASCRPITPTLAAPTVRFPYFCKTKLMLRRSSPKGYLLAKRVVYFLPHFFWKPSQDPVRKRLMASQGELDVDFASDATDPSRWMVGMDRDGRTVAEGWRGGERPTGCKNMPK